MAKVALWAVCTTIDGERQYHYMSSLQNARNLYRKLIRGKLEVAILKIDPSGREELYSYCNNGRG